MQADFGKPTYISDITSQARTYIRRRPQLRDVKDEMVLETAINGRTDALVTYNVRDFLSAAGRFGLRILRPGELLKELDSSYLKGECS